MSQIENKENATCIPESKYPNFRCLLVVRLLTRVYSRCGGAIGMYFLVKRCMVLYLYSGSGSYTQPPYLDVHGEFDYLMR